MQTVRVMGARFASCCGACGGPIRKGSPIRFVRGAAANHEGCGDPVARSGGYGLSGHRGRFERCEDAPCCGCCE
jgi:hypothetical protein